MVVNFIDFNFVIVKCIFCIVVIDSIVFIVWGFFCKVIENEVSGINIYVIFNYDMESYKIFKDVEVEFMFLKYFEFGLVICVEYVFDLSWVVVMCFDYLLVKL